MRGSELGTGYLVVAALRLTWRAFRRSWVGMLIAPVLLLAMGVLLFVAITFARSAMWGALGGSHLDPVAAARVVIAVLLVAIVAVLAVASLSSPAIAILTRDALQGGHGSLWAAMGKVVRRLAPVLTTLLAYWAAVLGLALLSALLLPLTLLLVPVALVGAAAWIWRPRWRRAWFRRGLVAIIPGGPVVYNAVRWGLCVPAAAIEGAWPRAAFRASARRVGGVWFTVAGLLLAANLLGSMLPTLADPLLTRFGTQTRLGGDLVVAIALSWVPAAVVAAIYLLRGEDGERLALEPAPVPLRPLPAFSLLTFAVPRRPVAVATSIALLLASWVSQPVLAAAPAGATTAPAATASSTLSALATCTGAPVVSFAPGSPQVAGTLVSVSNANDLPGCGSPEYQVLIAPPGGSATVYADYPATLPYHWDTSHLAGGVYTVTINLKDATSATSTYDQTASATFTVNAYSACSSAGLTFAPPSPVTPGTGLLFTASSSGCPNPVYQFLLTGPASGPTVVQAYGTGNTYSLDTTALTPGSYQMQVQARNADAAVTDAYDVQQSVSFVVGSCSAATISPSVASPQLVGTAVTFTGAALACTGPTYQFSVTPPGGTAQVAQAYSASPTFSWSTGGLAAGTYTVAVDVQTTGAGTPSFHAEMPYTIDVHCTSISASAYPGEGPPGPSTPIPLTATAGGCVSPLFQYQVYSSANVLVATRAYDPSGSWDASSATPGLYRIVASVVSAAAGTSTPDAQQTVYYRVDPYPTTITVTGNPGTTVHYQQAATFTASVVGSNGLAPADGDQVQFTLGAFPSVRVPLSGGQATFDLSPYWGQIYPPSTYPLAVSFNGDNSYSFAYTTIQVSIIGALTSTAITSIAPVTTVGYDQVGDVYYTVSVSVVSSSGSPIAGYFPYGLQAIVDGTALPYQFPLNSGASTFQIGPLYAGTHQVSVEFLGNSIEGASTSAPQSVTVQADVTNISESTTTPSVTYGLSTQFTAVVSKASPSTPFLGGTVTWYASGTPVATVNMPAYSQTGSVQSPPVYLPAGSYNITATYSGDAVQATSTTQQTFIETVSQAGAFINCPDFTTNTTTGGAGVPVTFTIRVTSLYGTVHEGQVQLTITNPQPPPGYPTTFYEYGTVDSSGIATITVSNFAKASQDYSVTAFYPAPQSTTNYFNLGGNTCAINISAPTAPTTLTISAPATQYGDDANVTVDVVGVGGGILATQPVSFQFGSNPPSTFFVDGNGQASLGFSNLAIGTYTLQASFPGDNNYGPSTASPTQLVITRRTPTVTLSADANPVVPTLPAVLTATVTGLSGLIPTGTVTFADGGTNLGTVALDGSGSASLTTTFATEGAHALTATYNDDAFYSPATGGYTENVARVAPAFVITAPTSMLTGNVSVTAALTEPVNNIAPTGSLTLLDGGNPIATVDPLTTNIGVLVGPLSSAGDHTLTVSYSGDTLYAPATSDPFTVTVNLVNSVVLMTIPASIDFADPATILASVVPAPGDTPGPTGSINIWEGGSSCFIADITQPNSSCDLVWDTTGPITVEADYSGDGAYAAASITQTVQVAPGAVTITVTQPSQWVIGQPLTLAWTTTGPPDGQIDITANPGNTGCAAQPLAGSCTFTLSGAGAIDVLVVYSGDPNWNITSVELTPAPPIQCYALTVQVTPVNSGTVATTQAPNCPSGPGWLAGTNVELVPTAASGYRFGSWAGPVDSFNDVTMSSDVFVLATFQPICYTLQLTPGLSNATTGGFLLPETAPNCGQDPTIDGSGNWNGVYRMGTNVTVDARPGYDANGQLVAYFMQTRAGITRNVTSVSVVLDQDQFVDATFGPPCYSVTLRQPASGGSVEVRPAAPACLFAPGYPRGTDMLLVATPSYTAGNIENDYWLNNWLTENTVDNPDGTVTTTFSPDAANPPPIPSQPGTNVILRHFTLTRDIVFGGDFAHCVQLTVNTVEQGTVTASPAGNCPIAGSGWYLVGTPVTLTAAGVRTSALTSTELLRWDGANSSPSRNAVVDGLPMSDIATVTMDQDHTVQATFMDPEHCGPLSYNGVGNGAVSVAWHSNCLPGQVEDGSPVVLVARGNAAGEVMGFTIQGLIDAHGNPAVVILPGQTVIWQKVGGTAPIRITGWFCATLQVQATVSTPYGSLDGSALGLNEAGFVSAQPAPDCPLGPFAWVVPAGAATPPVVTLSRHDSPPTYAVTSMTDSADPLIVPQPFTGALSFSFPPGQLSQTLNIAVSMTCFVLTTDQNTTASPAENCPRAPANAGAYLPGTVVQLHSQDLSLTGRYEFVNWTDVDGYQQLDAVVQMNANRNPRVTWGDLADLSYALAKGGQELVQAASPVVNIVTGGFDDITNAIGLNYAVDQVASWGPVNTVLNDYLPQLSRYEIPGINVTPDTLLVGLYTGGVGGVLLVAGATELDNYLGSQGDGEPLAPLLAAGSLKSGVLSCEVQTATGGESAIASPADSMSSCLLGKVDKLDNSLPQWGITPVTTPQLPGQ
jgi:large repetitive protein